MPLKELTPEIEKEFDKDVEDHIRNDDDIFKWLDTFISEDLYKTIFRLDSKQPEAAEIYSEVDKRALLSQYILKKYKDSTQNMLLLMGTVLADLKIKEDCENLDKAIKSLDARLGKLNHIVSSIDSKLSAMKSEGENFQTKINEEIQNVNQEVTSLRQSIVNLNTTISELQKLMPGSENRIANQVRGSLTQDLQRLGTLEGRIPENFAVTLETNIKNSLKNNFLNKGLFLGVFLSAVSLVIGAAGLASWGIYGRLGTLESNYSTLNSNINTLNGRIDGLQTSFNGRFDTLQGILLNQKTENNLKPSFTKSNPSQENISNR